MLFYLLGGCSNVGPLRKRDMLYLLPAGAARVLFFVLEPGTHARARMLICFPLGLGLLGAALGEALLAHHLRFARLRVRLCPVETILSR